MTGRRSISAVVVFLLVTLSVGAAFAQDAPPGFRQYDNYDRYQYLPRLPEGPENPRPFPDQPAEATGDPTELVAKLQGVIVLSDPQQVVESPDAVSGVDVRTGSRMMNSRGFRRIVASHIGRPISLLELNKLSRELILYYRRCNQPVVDISIPDSQDITDGVVQIVVTEARIGKVKVKGPCYFDAQVLADQLWLCPGSPIYESVLLREQRWLYRNPFRVVDIELSPGENRGETDVIFNIKDKKPHRVYGGYEDTGNQFSGLERTFYGWNWYDAFGKDDQLGYQYTASRDFNALGAHSGFYSKALENRDIITVYGNFAESGTAIPGVPFANQGETWQFLTRWYRELCPIGCYEHGVTAGFDFKRFDTALVFGGITLNANRVDLNQFMVGYHGKEYNCTGSWHVGIDAYMSPGDMSGHNRNSDFQGLRPFATSDFFYTRAYFERVWRLPHELEFMGRITGQLAEGNLLPSEQLGIGGYNSVRGYNLQSLLGDSGFFANLELRTQPVPLGLGCRCGLGDEFGVFEDEFSAHIFYDIGGGYNHTPILNDGSDTELQSVGIGFRYNLQRCCSIRFDYGWGIGNKGIPGQPAQPGQRVHLGTVLSY